MEDANQHSTENPGFGARQTGLWFWFYYAGCIAGLNFLYLQAVEGIAASHRGKISLIAFLHAAAFIAAVVPIDRWVRQQNSRALRGGWGVLVASSVAFLSLDLVLFRTLAIHLPTALRLVFSSGLDHAAIVIEATGIRAAEWWQGVAAFVTITAIMAGIYNFSLRRNSSSHRTTWKFAWSGAVLTLLTLSIWERSTVGNVGLKTWEEVHRVMPLTIKFTTPEIGLPLRVGPLRELNSQETPHEKFITPPQIQQEAGGSLPDIFVFIVESLRGDAVSKEGTPNLYKLQQDALQFKDSFANGNATQISWFSLLTSRQPLFFTTVKNNPKLWGSKTLSAFKDLGYRIEVLSASNLRYHKIDQVVFGDTKSYATDFLDANGLVSGQRPQRDREISTALIRRLSDQPGGRLFLLFFESTHHDYYWASDFPPKFRPYTEKWDYFDFAMTDLELAQLKNRYRNAAFFVDTLIGSAISTLESTGQYGRAIICATGDHGEEFLEHGKLLHSSELWREQIHVPILIKPHISVSESVRTNCQRITASHVDIFPTVLEILGARPVTEIDGTSLLSKTADFVVVADDNGGRDPYRFCILNGDRKAWLRYRSDSTLIRLDPWIFLTDITDTHDRALPPDSHKLNILREITGEPIFQLYPSSGLHIAHLGRDL